MTTEQEILKEEASIGQCPEMNEITNGLFTKKYTTVYGTDYAFNAFHKFLVYPNEGGAAFAEINFQRGPIKECGVNGVSNEDLILMVLTRLQQFQNSPYQCRENALAITKLEEAVMWLRKRTLDREARNVEGTNKI
jgi:hypothetical protein